MDFLFDVLKLFGDPIDLAFNTAGTKDMHPYSLVSTETGYKAICRTVGISKEDVNVSCADGKITVSGKTKRENEEYSVNFSIPVSRDVLRNIEKIRYKTENGLTYIYITTKKIVKPEISIEKLD